MEASKRTTCCNALNTIILRNFPFKQRYKDVAVLYPKNTPGANGTINVIATFMLSISRYAWLDKDRDTATNERCQALTLSLRREMQGPALDVTESSAQVRQVRLRIKPVY